MRRCLLHTAGVLAERHQLARVRVKGHRAREEPGDAAIRAEDEVDDVELTDLSQPQLVGVEAFVAAHGVDRVGRPDPFQQSLAAQPLVGARVVGRHAELVAPKEVHHEPVDRLGCPPRPAARNRLGPSHLPRGQCRTLRRAGRQRPR